VLEIHLWDYFSVIVCHFNLNLTQSVLSASFSFFIRDAPAISCPLGFDHKPPLTLGAMLPCDEGGTLTHVNYTLRDDVVSFI
jgi:hypothetical protein